MNIAYEEFKNITLNFLDVKLNVSSDGSFTTSVYTKVTDTGLYANFKSHTPENYKASVVKIPVARGTSNCLTWHTCHVELNRLRQVFFNNGYPQALVDKVGNNKLAQPLSNESKKEKKLVNFFV